MEFPKSREEVFEYLRNFKFEPKIISVEEYREYLRLTDFRCPKGRLLKYCDDYDCPTRLDDKWNDYYMECLDSVNAQIQLEKINEGKIIIVNNHEGWEIPL